MRTLNIVVCAIVLSGLVVAQTPKPIQSKLNVAVLDFDSRAGISKDEAASLSDIFSAELVNTGVFTVVERNRLKAVLEEQGLQQSEACSKIECAVEVGKILNVSRIVAGIIGKVGRIYTVTIQIINVETAQIDINKIRQHSGDIEELASTVMGEMSAEIASEVSGRKIQVTPRTTGTSWLWYAGGVAVIGGGAALAILNPDFFKDLFGKKAKEEGQLPAMPILPQ